MVGRREDAVVWMLTRALLWCTVVCFSYCPRLSCAFSPGACAPSRPPPQCGPPVRHRASRVRASQGTSGLPSLAFTALCCSHTQSEKLLREETLRGITSRMEERKAQRLSTRTAWRCRVCMRASRADSPRRGLGHLALEVLPAVRARVEARERIHELRRPLAVLIARIVGVVRCHRVQLRVRVALRCQSLRPGAIGEEAWRRWRRRRRTRPQVLCPRASLSSGHPSLLFVGSPPPASSPRRSDREEVEVAATAPILRKSSTLLLHAVSSHVDGSSFCARAFVIVVIRRRTRCLVPPLSHHHHHLPPLQFENPGK